MKRWCHTRVRTAVKKLFEQRQFVLVTKTLSFALMMVILILLIHTVVLSTASESLTTWSVTDCTLEIDNWDDKDVFFDNWFTSLSLISVLKEHGVRATGTVRADCLGRNLKINKKNIKCKEHGAMQVYCEKSGISCVTWNENRPVTIFSNVHANFPYAQVKRCDSSQRNYIKIS